tara:strand:+ start:715 stop:1113 length:399 start_codon:yes stop_codon:yes gene_type:complete
MKSEEFKKPVTVGLFVLLVLMIGLAAFGPNISGRAVSYTSVDASFDVYVGDEFPYKGWGSCSSTYGGWDVADKFCKYRDYEGALPEEDRPCRHEWKSYRSGWDGQSPMVPGSLYEKGYALTGFKCLPIRNRV